MTVMGQAPEAPPAVAPVPSAPDHANTVELRLALVCYGGVSLAIYMHGVTKEIQKLVAASKAYEQDQANCPFESGLTERSSVGVAAGTLWNGGGRLMMEA